ncbi:MAG: non-canonical purine NTP pyrophosphatase, partial [Propioniciclava sp.]
WSGPGASDSENLDLLLRQVSDVPEAERTARFVCTMALVLPDGREFVREGTMEGRLAFGARGSNGFGYDPAFIVVGESRTNGELEPHEKDARSHRGAALAAVATLIEEIDDGGRR